MIYKDIIERLKRESGGRFYEFEIQEIKPEIGQIGGDNDIVSNNITIYVSPDLEFDKESLRYLKKKKGQTSKLPLILDVGRHEIGHWEFPNLSKRGCPYDWFRAQEIYNGVLKGLKPSMKEYADYVTNTFMDVIDNTNLAFSLREMGDNLGGIVWFYYDQGKVKGRYSPFYQWMIDIQADLWMDKDDRKIVEKFYNKGEIGSKIKRLKLQLFEELGLKLRDYNLTILMDKEEWENQAKVFAKLASELLEEGILIEMLIGGERIGKESRIDKKMRDPSFQGRVVRKRWEKGKDMPTYLNQAKALSYLYRELAKDIPILVDPYTSTLSFPVVGYGRRECEEFSRTIGIDENGEVIFQEPKHYWEMPIAIKGGVGGVPNIYFVIDCSGSMQRGGSKPLPDAPWTDESKYHCALLGVYGVMNYLHRADILPQKIGLTSFSTFSQSLVASSENFEEIEKILFSPKFENTYLDLTQLRKISNSLGKSVILMLSDGEIQNWDEVSRGVKEVMERNYSAFISIEKRDEPFYDLRSVAKVFWVRDYRDLSKIMIDFTSRIYR